MERTLERFLKALRGLDVRVSVAETIEAHRAAALVGWHDRALLHDALAVTVAKTEEEKARFEECFDLFFQAGDEREMDAPGDEGAGEAGSAGSGPQGGEAEPGSPAGGGGSGEPGEQLARMILAGDRTGITAAMAAAAAEADLSRIRLFTQRGVFMRRILEAMGVRELEQAIRERVAAEDPDRMAEARALELGRERLIEEARALVERSIALYADPASERLREEFLARMRLGNIPQRDFARVRRIIRRLAKQLATRHARRHVNRRDGRLDVRRTLRRNMSHDGIPFRLAWRHTRIERPKVVAICDVSGSVAAAAQFLLLFLYSMQEVLADLRAFAFSSHLVEVTEILDRERWEEAVAKILEEIGFRPTDYGQTLLDLREGYFELIDRHTTVVILGDARNNEGDPRVEIMRELHERARRVVWLNPEPRSFWGTGDSEMLRYRPFCQVARVCNTIKHLERVVDELMSAGTRH